MSSAGRKSASAVIPWPVIVERIFVASSANDPVPDRWPFTLPAVRPIIGDGLRFSRPVTVLVGENGSGKSTIVEALAEAYGVDVRGGHAGRRYGSALPKSPLGERLRLVTTPRGARMKGRGAKGFFLRAETALGVFEFMSDYTVAGYGDRHLGRVSHGEGFLQVFEGRFTDVGLYILDEPEAALSFSGSSSRCRWTTTYFISASSTVRWAAARQAFSALL